MRKPIVAGNWKMNLGPNAGVSLAEEVRGSLCEDVEVIVFPPYVTLPAVSRTGVAVGAQDVFWADSGAFTGRISSPMLVELGVSHCLVGHSETRGRFGKLEVPEYAVPYFAESDSTINLKIHALLNHNIRPVLCVGETLAEREAGRTDSTIQTQLAGALSGVTEAQMLEVVVAYEPVWAIGTGKTCDTEEAGRVCAMVRAHLESKFGAQTAGDVRILYGGSVKASNAAELFRQSDIDGGLVGGASLLADEFCAIIEAARPG